jgi:hypothetical protein
LDGYAGLKARWRRHGRIKKQSPLSSREGTFHFWLNLN